MDDRLLFDISTSMKWTGPPVGIVRVERELAKWAMANEPRCQFVFFDGDLQAYREVCRNHLSAILGGSLILETTGMKDPSRARPRKTERIPRVMLGPMLWILQFRRMALRSLGALSLRNSSPTVSRMITMLQDLIGGRKYGAMLRPSDGSRRNLVGLTSLAGAPVQIKAGDIVLFAGSNWIHSNASYIAEEKRRVALDLVVLCFDAIPLLSPQFFKPHDVVMLKRHFEAALPAASLVLVNSQVIADDVKRYCAMQGFPPPTIRTIPLGVVVSTRAASAPPLPTLRFKKLILLVSTIEPRKGHDLAQRVWNRLLHDGIPQRLDAALVFVGRPGWMVEDLMERLATTERIVLLNNVEDGELNALYQTVEFCIYPSEYEGYGLPVVEALVRGKAVIASDTGVVPELQASLLKSVPRGDEQAWYEAMKDWLLKPPATVGLPPYRHPTWPEAAAQTFAAIYESRARINHDHKIEIARGG